MFTGFAIWLIRKLHFCVAIVNVSSTCDYARINVIEGFKMVFDKIIRQ